MLLVYDLGLETDYLVLIYMTVVNVMIVFTSIPDKLQHEILRQGMANEDELLLSLAGLKQVINLLNCFISAFLENLSMDLRSDLTLT